MQTMALSLGSDVPMCLASRPVWVEGVGEQLHPVAIPAGLGIVLLNPRQPLATPAVFESFNGVYDSPVAMPHVLEQEEKLLAWLGDTQNTLEAPAIHLAPGITAMLAALRATPGCLLARMSGSGATALLSTAIRGPPNGLPAWYGKTGPDSGVSPAG